MKVSLSDLSARRLVRGLEDHSDLSPCGSNAEPDEEGELFGPTLPDGRPRYRLAEELGRGGMGIVYRALDSSLGRVVALKRIHPGADAQARSRILQEARLASRLAHPAIVAIHDLGQHEGTPYFTMEFVDGSRLDRLGSLSVPRAFEIGRAVALAVAHAHKAGVLHRDLKPSNILVRADGSPVVTDFGLAKPLAADARLSWTGQVLGTPAYMAPEQLRGITTEHGPRTDVFGLGATLYHAIAGHPPPPFGIAGTLPREVAEILSRSLARDPADRYPTMEEFARDIECWLAGAPVLATFARARGRRRAVVGLLVIVLALVVWASDWGRNDPEGERAEELAAAAAISLEEAQGIRSSLEASRRRRILARALQSAGEACEIDSSSAAHLYLRAKIEAALGRYAEARRDFDRARELDPSFDLAARQADLTALREFLADRLATRDWARDAGGRDLLPRDVRTGEESPEVTQIARSMDVLGLFLERRFLESLEAARQIPESERLAESHVAAGLSAYYLAVEGEGVVDWDRDLVAESARYLRECVAIDPWFVEARVLLAEVLVVEGSIEEALGLLEGIVEAPERLLAVKAYILAIARYANGDWGGALASARDLLALEPDNREILADLTMIELRLGHREEALAALENLFRSAPEELDPTHLLLRAAVMSDLAGRPGEAKLVDSLLDQAEGDVLTVLETLGEDPIFRRREGAIDHPAYGTSLVGWYDEAAIRFRPEFDALRRSPDRWARIEEALAPKGE